LSKLGFGFEEFGEFHVSRFRVDEFVNWNLGLGIWNLGFRIWNLGFGILNLIFGI
jgi:hypothetical protein